MQQRVDRIFDNIEDKEVSHIIIKNGNEPFVDQTFFYLTKVTSGIFEQSYVIADRDSKITLVTSILEEESARKTDLNIEIYKTKKEKNKILESVIKNTKKIGFNSTEIDVESYMDLKKQFRGTKFVNISDAIKNARMVKDKEEISNIEKAAKMASLTFKDIKNSISEDKNANESSLSALITYSMMKNGASGPSFDTICAMGKNSAEPHYTPHHNKLKKGDLILCDYGAKYNHYCSDITRTFAFHADRKMEEIYEIVLNAQKEAIKHIKNGVKSSDIHRIASDIIDKSIYKGRFIHGLGHSLGLSVHDGFGVGPSSKIVLEENMVITVEPGIYVPGIGGVRIEDDVVVTKNGCRIITDAPKNWKDISIT